MSRGRRQGQKLGPYVPGPDRRSRLSPIGLIRLEAGLTQEEAAALCGVSVRTVRNTDIWGDTGSPACTSLLRVYGGRVTAALFDDCPVKAQAIALATQTGK